MTASDVIAPAEGESRIERTILIGSLINPCYTGGLAGYMRTLVAELTHKSNLTGELLYVYPAHPELAGCAHVGWPGRVVMGTSTWDLALKPVFSRMARHPALRGVISRILRLLAPEYSATFRGKVSTVHFVGTGWDFFGFWLADLAKKLGARFSVWPAVHPEIWGDDEIDIDLYRRADTVFCQSSYEMEHLAARGVPKSVLRFCGLPAMCLESGDGRTFRTSLELGERPTVLFLGRRDPGKGYPALLKAWRIVLSSLPEAVLILAGPGGEPFEKEVIGLPAGAIRDLGMPDEQQKADALAASDILCLPSSHESFGITYVEAWSYGKPVICGSAPASRELVQDGQTGLWSDGSPESIADKLLTLLTRPALRAKLGDAGRTLQQNRYSTSAMLEAHIAAWELA